jgi:hypothetical protein
MLWVLENLSPSAYQATGDKITIVRIGVAADSEPRLRLYETPLDAYNRGDNVKHKDVLIRKLRGLNPHVILADRDIVPQDYKILSFFVDWHLKMYCSADYMEVIL